MGLPRSAYVQEGEKGVYHCYCRCVRRAFLYGFDPYSGRDYSHRKAWIVDKMRHLASIFAINVCGYAVMDNHYHTILHTRPDISTNWSDHEVAARWLKLFPKYYILKGLAESPIEERIRHLLLFPELITTFRQRLSSVSWFMGQLNEFIARSANKEDQVKGRFWESRFKCQALLDEAAIAACMVYVDLNPIRAGLAKNPEDSDFTSIQQRIRKWYQDSFAAAVDPAPENYDWLGTVSNVLPLTDKEYFDLVDRSARLISSDKHTAADLKLPPILNRIRAKSDSWPDTISNFGDKFSLAAGQKSNLRRFAARLGRCWFKGISEAQSSFASSP